jgi:hypothetical protein
MASASSRPPASLLASRLALDLASPGSLRAEPRAPATCAGTSPGSTMTPLIQNSETGESNGGTGEGGGREWGEDSEDEWDENRDDESVGGVAASREDVNGSPC